MQASKSVESPLARLAKQFSLCLAACFIPSYRDAANPLVRSRYGTLSGILGVVLNSLLFALKLTAGLLSHSVSILADAFNNLSDASSSLALLLGFRLSRKEADTEHPFGHGRYEYIAGLLISFLILLMGIELFQHSIRAIWKPQELSASTLTFAFLGLGIVVKLLMFLYNLGFSTLCSSEALRSTAMDSISDVAATSVVLISILLYERFQIRLDGPAGLLVSLLILWNGYQSMKATISPLLGEAADKELETEIEAIVMTYPNVLGIHDLVIHNYGPYHSMISLHVEVPATMNIVAAHELIDKIEEDLDERFHTETVIHEDPVDLEDPKTQLLSKVLTEELSHYKSSSDAQAACSFHDLRVIHGLDRLQLLFDLSIPFAMDEEPAHIEAALRTKLAEVFPDSVVHIHIDRS